jgi:uncharacterized BrkB/YihY/UPF0761 family membrane protein
MSPSDIVNLPPTPKILDYPALMAVAFGVLFTSIMLLVVGRFDPTGGALAISLLVTLAFIGVVAICLFYTIPNDEITSGAVGGLIAAFGAVVAHWLGRNRKDRE